MTEETKSIKPDEAQKNKEEFEKGKEESMKQYNLPSLKITEEDKDLYAKCLVSGTPYFERFAKEKFGINIVFRDKTKKEGDIISRQLDSAANKGIILSQAEYTNSYNLGCLYYQMEELNGVVQVREYPKSLYDQSDFNLLQKIDESYLGSVTSAMVYLLMGMMTQFNEKILSLSREVLDPNFS